MVTKYYRVDNGDWDTDARWSTASGGAADTTFPTAGDDAIPDANSGNCTLDANAACDALIIGTVGSLYTGTLDAATFNVALGTGGLDCTYGGSATLDLGTGTWTITDGPLDYGDIGTLDDGSSTVVMVGTGTIIASGSWTLYNLTINGSTTLHADTTPYLLVAKLLQVSAGNAFTLNALLQMANLSDMQVGIGATVDGSGTLRPRSNFSVQDGTVSVATLDLMYTLVLAAAEYQSATVRIGIGWASTLTVEAGTVTFAGNVTFDPPTAAGWTYTIANDTNDPSWVFQGDVTVNTGAGLIVWTKGIGDITFDDTADQDVDFNGLSVEDIIVDKTAGTLTLTGAVTTDSFTGTAGTLDPNAQTLTVSGAVALASGFTVADPAGSTIDCNTFTADGQDFSIATGAWYINAATSATITGGVTINYLDARGGVEVNAEGCVEGIECYNVNFGVNRRRRLLICGRRAA